MAVEPRSGSSHGGSGLMLGFQSAYGTPITQNSDMIPRLFTIDSMSPNIQTETLDDPAIVVLGASAVPVQGRSSAEFVATVGIYPEEIMHFLRGIFNPDITSPESFTKATVGDTPAGTLSSGFLPNDPRYGSSPNQYYWPSQLKYTNTGGTYANDAKMELIGFAQEGVERSKLRRQLRRETVPLTDANDGGTSTGFFQQLLSSGEITGADAVVVSGVSGGSPTFTWEGNTHITTAKLRTSDPTFPGFTAFGIEGGVPFVQEDMVPRNLALDASDTGMSITLTGIGTVMDWERTVAGGPLNRKLALDSSDVSYFQKQTDARMAPWAGELKFGDLILPWDTVSLAFERNYEFSGAHTGKRIRRGVTASANRSLTINVTIPLEAPTELTDTDYLDATDLYRRQVKRPLTLIMNSYDENDRQRRIIFNMPQALITEEPQRTVDGGGPISISLVLQAFTTGTVTSEIDVTAYSENEYTAP